MYGATEFGGVPLGGILPSASCDGPSDDSSGSDSGCPDAVEADGAAACALAGAPERRRTVSASASARKSRWGSGRPSACGRSTNTTWASGMLGRRASSFWREASTSGRQPGSKGHPRGQVGFGTPHAKTRLIESSLGLAPVATKATKWPKEYTSELRFSSPLCSSTSGAAQLSVLPKGPFPRVKTRERPKSRSFGRASLPHVSTMTLVLLRSPCTMGCWRLCKYTRAWHTPSMTW
mmetsp:Transcript_8212/g.22841  ORF Transcript_8212/g.22841 Transcript_8212/m.22841 type:complete len:235 (+) Transcript_8212:175-879(+)